MTQRWREGRDSYRPAGEPIDPRRFGVEVVHRDEGAAFVRGHHYSRSCAPARLTVGLWRSRGQFWAPELAGVAVFGVGIQPASLTRWCGVDPAAGVELVRFVLLDDVEANGETWFLRRAFAEVRGALPDVRAVLAYSDPERRTSLDGRVVLPGHVGTIYQAHNGRYVGRSSSRWLWLDPAGRVVSDRALSKIRNDERNAAGAARTLLDAGAPPRRIGEDPAAWVARALAEGPFRRVRHPGNHVYAWPLDGRRDTARGLAAEVAPRPKVGTRGPT
jgi:hypothetical protein